MVENVKELPFFKQKRGTLQLAVWKNKGKNGGEWFSTTLVRNYMDKASNTWKKTTSLRTQDLMLAVQLLTEAHQAITAEAPKASSPSSSSSQEEVEEITRQINVIENRIDFLESDESNEEYDEFLDELGEVKIGSLTYSTSRVLREVDPIAYRCGKNDWIDSEISDLEPQKEDLEAELKLLTSSSPSTRGKDGDQ